MILYLDASALVKLYVEEAGTSVVAGRIQRAEAVATILITYAESRAALARHRRDGALSVVDLRRAVRELDREWGAYNIVDLTDGLVRSAGALAERHALRGYDAVQLAAALDLSGRRSRCRILCLRYAPQPGGTPRAPLGVAHLNRPRASVRGVGSATSRWYDHHHLHGHDGDPVTLLET